jgi:hypothetical protein
MKRVSPLSFFRFLLVADRNVRAPGKDRMLRETENDGGAQRQDCKRRDEYSPGLV